MKKSIFAYLFFLALLASSPSEASEKNWVLLGNSPLGKWPTYIDVNNIMNHGNGLYTAATYEDMGITQGGIDVVGKDGQLYFDTSVKYRSSRSVDTYDCLRRLIANHEIRYYSGAKPKKSELVYRHVEESPQWIEGIVTDDVVFNYLCHSK